MKTHAVTFSGSYLYKLHHWDWVEEVKAAEPVQPAGGAGDVRDGQRGCVAGKDGVSKRKRAETQLTCKTSRHVPLKTFRFIVL